MPRVQRRTSVPATRGAAAAVRSDARSSRAAPAAGGGDAAGASRRGARITLFSHSAVALRASPITSAVTATNPMAVTNSHTMTDATPSTTVVVPAPDRPVGSVTIPPP